MSLDEQASCAVSLRGHDANQDIAGAGKSSLTLALFQFIRASQGTIYIDGLDISKLKLEHLRSRLAIIPQDPVLFSGTVRSNLDPFNEHSDAELQEALQRVHLIKPPGEASGSVTPEDNQNKNMFNRMDSKISEGGLNLSQGQRQLLLVPDATPRSIPAANHYFTGVWRVRLSRVRGSW